MPQQTELKIYQSKINFSQARPSIHFTSKESFIIFHKEKLGLQGRCGNFSLNTTSDLAV